ncbi:restriction endonuclease subunit S [Streptomyces sp. NPDC056470]|uniref:restriction endonuclease subunit S n=1 Tax=Streptomyces sp. NPDC056470 TaxID=3345831 RepID=UPI0036A132F2
MSEWPRHKLGELCTRITVGHVGSMASRYADTGIPFLRSLNIKRGRIDLSDVKYIDKEFHDELAKSQLRPGDLAIVRTGEPGTTALIPEEMGPLNCSDIVIATPRPDVDARFLCYAINETAQDFVKAHTVGAVQQHFNVRSAKELTLNVPLLAQQQAISGLLGSLDDKIAVNERIAATARELGLGLFSQAAAMGESVEVAVATVSSTLTRGVAPKYSENSDDLVVLNQKCIRDGRVSLTPARLTLRDKVKAPKLLVRNDVLVNSTGVGTLGRVARWTSGGEGTVDSHITIVRFDKSLVDPVCAGFAMLQIQPEIEAMGEGSTGQTELRRAQLGALQIILPSRARQAQLRPKLDALEERADQALAESAALATLRDSLLPQLMSGRLRVRDAEKIVEDHV